MICLNCQKENSDGSRFCQFCGVPLSAPAEEPVVQEVIQEIIVPAEEPVMEAIPEKTEKEMSEDVDKLYRAVDMVGICEIIEKNIKQFEAYVQKDEGNIRREVEVVKRYIYAHYGEELSVELLAEQVFLAPSYLSTIFRKETGQNLSKFIKSYRMEKAREMLENTHEKIVMISEKVGYPNVSYFCQNFREYFGISPQKYRDKGEVYEESSGMD